MSKLKKIPSLLKIVCFGTAFSIYGSEKPKEKFEQNVDKVLQWYASMPDEQTYRIYFQKRYHLIWGYARSAFLKETVLPSDKEDYIYTQDKENSTQPSILGHDGTALRRYKASEKKLANELIRSIENYYYHYPQNVFESKEVTSVLNTVWSSSYKLKAKEAKYVLKAFLQKGCYGFVTDFLLDYRKRIHILQSKGEHDLIHKNNDILKSIFKEEADRRAIWEYKDNFLEIQFLSWFSSIVGLPSLKATSYGSLSKKIDFYLRRKENKEVYALLDDYTTTPLSLDNFEFFVSLALHNVSGITRRKGA